MQNTALDNNVYFLLLLGVVAVGAHAYSLFNQPIDRPSASTRWRFLSTIPIQLATTQSRFRLGLVLYIIVFELIYLVLASSSSLLLMTYQMSGRQDLTGALSETVSPNGTVTILASTAIILLTQIRPLSQVELILRRFAHRMARVPDGLRLVKQRASTHLRRAKLPDENTISEELAGMDGLADQDTGDRLKRSQAVTAWLFENTLGTRGALSWDEEGSEQLLQLFHSLKFEVMQLRGDILEAARPADNQIKKNPKHGAPAVQPQGPWQELLNRSLHLEERLTLLLCLLLINQPEIDTKDDHELQRLIDSTRRREQSEVSDIAIKSCVVGILASLLVLFVYERGDTLIRQELRQSPYSARAPFGEYVNARVNANDELATLYPFQGLTLEERQELVIGGSVQSDLNTAVNETLWTAITFFCTVFVVLSMNTHNIQVWRTSSQTQKSESVTPAAHYALIAISASVTAATVLFVYLFITKALMRALRDNIDVLSFEIMGPFSSMLPTVMSYSLASIVCAIFVIWLDGIFASRAFRVPVRTVEKTGPKPEIRILKTLTSIASRLLSSIWLMCALAAASIAILVLATSIATGKSVELLEVFNSLGTSFAAFLCFLVVLVYFMQSHPQRYLQPTAYKSGEEKRNLPAPPPKASPPQEKARTQRKRARSNTGPETAGG